MSLWATNAVLAIAFVAIVGLTAYCNPLHNELMTYIRRYG